MLTPFPPWLYLWVDGKKWGMPCLWKGNLFISLPTLITLVYYFCHAYIKPHKIYFTCSAMKPVTWIYLQELKSSPHICIPVSLHTCYKTCNKAFSLNVVSLELCKGRLNWNKSTRNLHCLQYKSRLKYITRNMESWTICIRDLFADNFWVRLKPKKY